MTAYYVDSSASGSNNGTSWTNAYTSFGSAVTAATADGDIIYVDQGHAEALGANTTYTFANNVSVICSNDKANTPPQTLGSMGTTGYIGHTSSSYTIILAGAYKVYLYGITFRSAGTSGVNIALGNTDGSCFELDNCYIWVGTTGPSSRLVFGNSGGINSYVKCKNCTFRFGSTSQGLDFSCALVQIENTVISSSGSAPTTFVVGFTRAFPGVYFEGCDLSHITGTLIGSSSAVPAQIWFSNCKLGSGVTILATQTPANKSSSNVWLFNCSSGDQHYHIQHHDAFGSTVCDTGIYANDGASYDGTNRLSWKIVTTANCSYYNPYISPWIDCYHSGTSAITPSLEICRSGSATAYQDDEVWGEFSYQGTSGFPISTIVNDRKGLLAAAADQTTGALGASDWTGENATSWFGKLNPTATITPAEIGHLRARVAVGEPSITVYVDPQIRGRS